MSAATASSSRPPAPAHLFLSYYHQQYFTLVMSNAFSRTHVPYESIILRLWRRLVSLFKRGRAKDLEAAIGVADMSIPVGNKVRQSDGGGIGLVKQEPVPTFKPELAGVPALALASMAVSAALTPPVPVHVKMQILPLAPPVPVIIVTLPSEVDVKQLAPSETHTKTKEDDKHTLKRAPFKDMNNVPTRVHGRIAARHFKIKAKENMRNHPNAPRRPQLVSLSKSASSSTSSPSTSPSSSSTSPSTTRQASLSLSTRVASPSPPTSSPAPAPASLSWNASKKLLLASHRTFSDSLKDKRPGSAVWQADKERALSDTRKWNEEVRLKARRRVSLPIPPPSSPPPPVAADLPRRASAPARLSIQERLRRAVAVAKKSEPVIPPRLLWGDTQVSFVLGDGDDEEGDTPAPITVTRKDVVHSSPAPAEASQDADSSISASSSLTSTDSISSVLDALEDVFDSPTWLGLRTCGEMDAQQLALVSSADSLYSAESDSDHWSDVVSLDDYV
ncbi:hypothetical protein B0H10DRAFT_2436208 [Mycena sp. CBHHK59/15]|nr:hypothetical protein B0H10DRAFT_2436208 [Mycena sp. CBHHK59/15]